MRKKAYMLAGSLLVAGCVSYSQTENLAKPAEEAIEATFQCGNGKRFEVAFIGDKAKLSVGGAAHMLSQTPSGSGYAYAGEGHSLRGKGKDAIWTEPSGAENSCFEIDPAHAPQILPPGPPVTRGLPGTKWRLVHFESSDDSIGKRIPPNPEKYILHFASDGSLSAQLDCNRLAGSWKAAPASPTGGGLEISGGAMTRAMCPPGAMDTAIARDLAYVRSYTIVGTTLNLALQADAGIYSWAAIPPE